MRIIIMPEVVDYFLELAEILYDKGYFGFEENAIKYARDLFLDIEKELPFKQKKKAPAYFNQYGKDMYYFVFKRNKNTSWYVFFNVFRMDGDMVFLVRYVNNNHTIAHFF